jgi:LysM repeat protein
MSAMTEIALTCDSEIRRDHPQGRRPRASAPPLRLTRRGRIVIAVAAVLLVTVISLLAAGVAQATGHGPSRAARQDLVQVVVRPGQTLWSVAESADPDQDTRVVVQQIIDLNSLASTAVPAGRQLWVPRG